MRNDGPAGMTYTRANRAGPVSVAHSPQLARGRFLAAGISGHRGCHLRPGQWTGGAGNQSRHPLRRLFWLGISTKLQKFACETVPGPLPTVAAQQAFPSHDRREWYDANFRNLVLDRYSDLALYMGLLVYYASINRFFYIVLTAIVMTGSVMVSYIRTGPARAGAGTFTGHPDRGRKRPSRCRPVEPLLITPLPSNPRSIDDIG